MRKGFVLLWLALLLTGVVAVFWYSEFVYSLPTPMPKSYKDVKKGTVINLNRKLAPDSKPVLLHFFNPDCPCSRFNMKHFKELVKQYKDQVNFTIVLMTDKDYTEPEIQDTYKLRIPVVKDSSLAAMCGVYSTPQAVILNSDHTLYYRGNYNRTRYCTDKKTNYAQIALEGLLKRKPTYAFDKFALKAYGCELPGCTD
mgnify:CR=1 FL=1